MAVLTQLKWQHWQRQLQYGWEHATLLSKCCVTMCIVCIGLAIYAMQIDRHQHTPDTLVTTPVKRSGQTPVQPTEMQAVKKQSASHADQWPVVADAEAISADILSEADSQGLIFERAEFALETLDAMQALAVQHIHLPVKGDYLQLRHFLSLVLQRNPSLALTDFSIHRADASQTEIEAQLSLSLYLRRGAD